MKNETWAAPGPADPLGLMLFREHTRIEKSGLPGADQRRVGELRAMYRLYPPQQRAMLRAIRAQRGIDAFDIFHAVMTQEWHVFDARSRAILQKISRKSVPAQRALKGLARNFG